MSPNGSPPKLAYHLVQIIALVIGAPVAYFVFSSYASPRFWDIVLSSIGLSLIVGVSASVAFLFVERWSHGLSLRPTIRGVAVLSGLSVLLLLGAAASILAANQPAKVKADIPFTYAFDCQTSLLPNTIQFESDDASAAYWSIRDILKSFGDASATNREKIEGFSNLGLVNTNFESVTLLRDLSEYAVLYWLSTPVVTQEISDVMYREEGGRWLAFPATSIRGGRVFLSDVAGDFQSNSFFGYRDRAHPREAGLNLPQGMRVTVEHVGIWTSRIRLENAYVAVTIGVEIASHRSGGVAILAEQQFPQAWLFGDSEYSRAIAAEQRARYYIAGAVVHFDAEFDRFRYGFAKMRDHENWVTDLQGFLERNLAWGAIDYAHVTDVSLNRLASVSGCRVEG